MKLKILSCSSCSSCFFNSSSMIFGGVFGLFSFQSFFFVGEVYFIPWQKNNRELFIVTEYAVVDEI